MGIEIFAFSTRNLNIDPMTFIYEHYPYFPQKYRICEYELSQGFRKFIVWQTYRQTNALGIIQHAASQVVNNDMQARV